MALNPVIEAFVQARNQAIDAFRAQQERERTAQQAQQFEETLKLNREIEDRQRESAKAQSRISEAHMRLLLAEAVRTGTIKPPTKTEPLAAQAQFMGGSPLGQQIQGLPGLPTTREVQQPFEFGGMIFDPNTLSSPQGTLQQEIQRVIGKGTAEAGLPVSKTDLAKIQGGIEEAYIRANATGGTRTTRTEWRQVPKKESLTGWMMINVDPLTGEEVSKVPHLMPPVGYLPTTSTTITPLTTSTGQLGYVDVTKTTSRTGGGLGENIKVGGFKEIKGAHRPVVTTVHYDSLRTLDDTADMIDRFYNLADKLNLSEGIIARLKGITSTTKSWVGLSPEAKTFIALRDAAKSSLARVGVGREVGNLNPAEQENAAGIITNLFSSNKEKEMRYKEVIGIINGKRESLRSFISTGQIEERTPKRTGEPIYKTQRDGIKTVSLDGGVTFRELLPGEEKK